MKCFVILRDEGIRLETFVLAVRVIILWSLRPFRTSPPHSRLGLFLFEALA